MDSESRPVPPVPVPGPRTGPSTEPGTGLPPAPVPAASTAQDSKPGTAVLGTASTPVLLSRPERASTAARRAGTAVLGTARELWLDPGRLLHSLYHGRPGSMAEHMAYLKSAAWVPEELDGRPRQFLTVAGIAYHVLIAWPLKLAAKAIDAAADRPLRLAGLIALTVALFVIL